MTWKMLWFSGRDSRVQFAIPLVLGLLGTTLQILLIENQTAIANSTTHALFADTSRTGFSFDGFTVAQGDAVARAIDTAIIVSRGFAVVLAYVLAAAAVRRLHDIHRRGWHYLLLLVPVYNIYLLCLMCFKKGESANSVHGAPPLKGAAPLRARLSLAVLLLPLLAATVAPGFVASIGMPRSVQHPNSKEKAMKAFMAVVHDGMENMRLEARVGAQDVEIWDGEQRICVVPRPQDTPARQSVTKRLGGWIKARWDSIRGVRYMQIAIAPREQEVHIWRMNGTLFCHSYYLWTNANDKCVTMVMEDACLDLRSWGWPVAQFAESIAREAFAYLTADKTLPETQSLKVVTVSGELLYSLP